MKVSLTVILNLFFLSVMFGQVDNLRFQQFTSKDGLSHNTVYSIVQDHQGFVWFGTEEGLNRFDAYNFDIWQESLTEAYKTSMQATGNLMVDSKGHIWIGSWGSGLICLNPETNAYRQFVPDVNLNESISENRIQTLLEDSHGNLWFGTYQSGLDKYYPEKDRIKNFRNDPTDPNSLSNNRIWAMAEGPKGNIWIGTGNGLNVMDPEKETIQRYQSSLGTTDNLLSGEIRELLFIGEDLWVGTTAAIHLIDTQSGDIKTYDCKNTPGLPCVVINKLFMDSDSVFWIGTGRGLSRYRIDEYKNLSRLPLDENLAELDQYFIRDIYEDVNRILWIATDDHGIFKVSNTKPKFHHIREVKNVTSILVEQSGITWIGSDLSGLNKYDPHTNSFHNFLPDPQNRKSNRNKVNAIHKGENNQLWVGISTGLVKFDPLSNEFTTLPFEGLGGINVIVEDYSDQLWIGTYKNGLFRFDKATETFTHYSHDAANIHGLGHMEIWTLQVDDDNNLWIGTGNGLDYYDQKTQRFDHFRYKPDDTSSIKGQRIKSLYRDQSGTLWVGTDAGLSRFNEKENVFTNFSMKDGLPSDMIESILEDESGDLWIGTNRGLARFGSAAGDYSNYDLDDGLQDRGFYFGASYKGPDGKMYFGGINGVNVFHPDSIIENTIPPPVILTNFRKIGQADQQLKNISGVDKLELSYEDKVFSIEFTALDYSAPSMNKYAYKLEGLHDEWIETDYRDRKVTFTGLSPGSYKFQVKASNNDNYWNESGASIDIIIAYPWWQSTWFTLLLSTVLVMIVVLIFRVRTYSLRKGKEELQRQVEKRTANLLKAKEQAEHAKRSLEFTQFAIDKIDNMAYWVNIDNAQFIYVNKAAAERLGYTMEEMAEMTVSEVDMELSMEMWPKFRQQLKKGKPLEFESTHKTKSGELYPVEILTQYVVFGNEERIIAFGKDITERKKVEEDLKRAKSAAEAANRAKSTFLANMSHEIRTPMNAILGHSQILQRDRSLSDHHMKSIQSINKSGEHLLGLINDILDISKIEAGKIRLLATSFGLHTLIYEIKEMFRFKMQEKALSFDVLLAAGVPEEITADKNRVRQVIINLLSNAFKFTQAGGITLRITARDTTIIVEVTDTGPGIPEGDRELIFGSFEQTDKGIRSGGTGLGLTISRQIAQLMGGNITVESTVGKGSSFRFTFDYKPADESLHAEIDTDRIVRRLAPNQPEVRALVVDDKEDNRNVARQFLDSVGFIVREAVDGREAVEMTGEWKPQIILMDVVMPEMNGLEATTRIRAMDLGYEVAIIMLSASALDEEREFAMENGANAFIKKPYKDIELYENIRKYADVEYEYDELKGLETELIIDRNNLNIGALPEELIKKLSKAAKLGKMNAISELLPDIAVFDNNLSNYMKTLIDEFQLQKIQQILET